MTTPTCPACGGASRRRVWDDSSWCYECHACKLRWSLLDEVQRLGRLLARVVRALASRRDWDSQRAIDAALLRLAVDAFAGALRLVVRDDPR